MQEELAERSSDLVHVVAVHSDHSTMSHPATTLRATRPDACIAASVACGATALAAARIAGEGAYGDAKRAAEARVHRRPRPIYDAL